MREFEADILSAADGNAMPDGKCVHLVYLKSEVDARIAELEKSHERYEKVRRMNPQQFIAIYLSNLQTGVPFDDLVDLATL